MKKIKQSLNLAFRKLKPLRREINKLKENLNNLFHKTATQLNQSEEYHKNNLRDFLNNTYYENKHYINTKDRQDLVIHQQDNDSKVGIIIEIKKPNNQNEMLKIDNFNVKSLQQILYYYLEERITHQNIEIKHLIITDIYNWFIFNANLFEEIFYQNKELTKKFKEFKEGKLTSKKQDFFYQEIASKFIGQNEEKLKENCTYFNLKEYQNCRDDNDLIPLYKILSPEHLLKLSFVNDSNTLDTGFYYELLHIIGLTEVEKNNITLIKRLPENKRNQGSLLENTINQLEISNKIDTLNNHNDYGNSYQEKVFNIALELVITWVNRILFLKLLEAQLISFNNDKKLEFLNNEKIKNFNELDSLFFQILAKERIDRREDINNRFYYIPYLNSSLFEVSKLEIKTLLISSLNYDQKLPLFKRTILQNNQGEKLTGELKTLNYLFEFLAAYDFSSEGKEEIQEENKTLINASVLGLIFEKLNGYKEGSFFTPGFITMYICKETITKTVIRKFNQIKGWNCEKLEDLYNEIKDKKEANLIINNIKICDPAVGSGHFLVSALNEMIAIKSELDILLDKQGKLIRKIDYTIAVENDELVIYSGDKLFSYNPHNQESQRIQETIFKEKQTIIENCLFGVDINPNSVKICNLRLWIELLKNAYYHNPPLTFPLSRGGGGYPTLETLPNIDINIKCGNSLISRFALDANLGGALKRNGLTISTYKQAIKNYHITTKKEEKRGIIDLIRQIKDKFKTAINSNDNLLSELRKKEGELENLKNQTILLEETLNQLKTREKQIKNLENQINLLRNLIEDKINNSVYDKAFEWRFEFPEVLDEEGDFVGFDVVMGNPPYGVKLTDSEKTYFQQKFVNQDYQLDTYLLFIEQGFLICADETQFTYIIPNTWLTNLKFKKIRSFIFNQITIKNIAHYQKSVFKKAVVDTQAVFFSKEKLEDENKVEIRVYENEKDFTSKLICQSQGKDYDGETINIFLEEADISLKNKLDSNSQKLGDLFKIVSGLVPYEVGKGKPKQTQEDVTNRVFDATRKLDKTYRKLLRGSDVNKYRLQWKSKVWLKYGDNLAAPRYSANFEAAEKIVIRQTGDTLTATIDDKKFICMKNLHVITSKPEIDLSLKYLLALLNSKLLDYYHSLLNPEKGEALAEVKKENVAKLPIKNISTSQQKPLIDLVIEILQKKKANPKVNTRKLEREIDLLVYEIYGLTETEIAIIESSYR